MQVSAILPAKRENGGRLLNNKVSEWTDTQQLTQHFVLS